MKKRTLKKRLKKLDGLQSVIDNAHDVAVANFVLWSIYIKLRGGERKVILPADPFRSDELNNILEFLWQTILEK